MPCLRHFSKKGYRSRQSGKIDTLFKEKSLRSSFEGVPPRATVTENTDNPVVQLIGWKSGASFKLITKRSNANSRQMAKETRITFGIQVKTVRFLSPHWVFYQASKIYTMMWAWSTFVRSVASTYLNVLINDVHEPRTTITVELCGLALLPVF